MSGGNEWRALRKVNIEVNLSLFFLNIHMTFSHLDIYNYRVLEGPIGRTNKKLQGPIKLSSKTTTFSKWNIGGSERKWVPCWAMKQADISRKGKHVDSSFSSILVPQYQSQTHYRSSTVSTTLCLVFHDSVFQSVK